MLQCSQRSLSNHWNDEGWTLGGSKISGKVIWTKRSDIYHLYTCRSSCICDEEGNQCTCTHVHAGQSNTMNVRSDFDMTAWHDRELEEKTTMAELVEKWLDRRQFWYPLHVAMLKSVTAARIFDCPVGLCVYSLSQWDGSTCNNWEYHSTWGGVTLTDRT